MPNIVSILGTSIALSSPAEVQQAIANATQENRVRIATVNPEFLLDARKQPAFRSALSNMTNCTVDGSGLLFLIRILSIKTPLYHGVDMIEELFSAYQNGEKSFFFLGSAEGVAVTFKKAIQAKYPNIHIVGAMSGGKVTAESPMPDEASISEITKTKPDILLVGFGAPKQELFINTTALEVPVMIGVGGTFDFYTTKRRAPKLFRTLHLEWLHRTFSEKGHWKRAFRATAVFSTYAFLWLFKIAVLRGSDAK